MLEKSEVRETKTEEKEEDEAREKWIEKSGQGLDGGIEKEKRKRE